MAVGDPRGVHILGCPVTKTPIHFEVTGDPT